MQEFIKKNVQILIYGGFGKIFGIAINKIVSKSAS
jgi:hypothetical protein